MKKFHRRVIKYLKNERLFILCSEHVILDDNRMIEYEYESINHGVEITFYY